MSFQAMTWAVDQNLPTNQKMVLLMLANRTNHDTGRCDPSHKRLAADCGMGVTTLKRALAALEQAGLVSVIQRKEGDVNLPNQYQINMGGVGPQRTDPQSKSDRPPVQIGLTPRPNRTEGVGPERPTKQEYNNQELKQEYNQNIYAPAGVESEQVQDGKSCKKKKTGLTSMDSFDLSSWPANPSEQIWADWVKNRKQLRAAITQTAITRLGNQLTQAAQSGYSVDECLGKCIERGWRGFEARWMLNAESGKNRPAYFRPGAAPVNYHEGVDEDGRF